MKCIGVGLIFAATCARAGVDIENLPVENKLPCAEIRARSILEEDYAGQCAQLNGTGAAASVFLENRLADLPGALAIGSSLNKATVPAGAWRAVLIQNNLAWLLPALPPDVTTTKAPHKPDSPPVVRKILTAAR